MNTIALKPMAVIVLLCWCNIHTAICDSVNNGEVIRGLLNTILSSSAQGEPTIDISRGGSGDDETQPDNGEETNDESDVTTNTLNKKQSIALTTNDILAGIDSTTELPGDSELSQAVPLAQNRDRILKSRLMNEREREKSHSDAQELRKAQVKTVLLRKLRLSRLPNPKLADFYKRFPSHLLEGLGGKRMPMDQPTKEDNYHAKIQQMIRFSQAVPSQKATRIQEDKVASTMYFPMPFSLTVKGLEKATLLVYINTPPGLENEVATLKILTNPWDKIVVTREVLLDKGGHWEHVDITTVCKHWLKNEWNSNLGVRAEAEVRGIDVISYNSNHSGTNFSLERIPLVKLQLNDQEYVKRNRRSVSSDLPLDCNPEDNESRCCRYPFVLDFDELGPDFKFIISPKRYYANYCKGICPEYVLPNNVNIQLTRGVNKAQRCCSPSSVSSLTLIYMNEQGDVMKGIIPGMSISSCGCD